MDPNRSRLLDGIDIAEEKIKNVQEEAAARKAMKLKMPPTQKFECDADGIPLDKSCINITALESYMPVFKHVAVGNRWISGDPKYYIPLHNIKYVLNLRQEDGDKGLWYVEKAKKAGVREVIHEPMETAEDTDRTRVSDDEVIRVANRVVRLVRKLAKEEAGGMYSQPTAGQSQRSPSIFIHGYQGAHLAMVVALVAWFLLEDDNKFNPMKQLEERYDEAIVENFPEHWFHREQIKRICDRKRKSVYAAMKRGKMEIARTRRRSTAGKEARKRKKEGTEIQSESQSSISVWAKQRKRQNKTSANERGGI